MAMRTSSSSASTSVDLRAGVADPLLVDPAKYDADGVSVDSGAGVGAPLGVSSVVSSSRVCVQRRDASSRFDERRDWSRLAALVKGDDREEEPLGFAVSGRAVSGGEPMMCGGTAWSRAVLMTMMKKRKSKCLCQRMLFAATWTEWNERADALRMDKGRMRRKCIATPKMLRKPLDRMQVVQ